MQTQKLYRIVDSSGEDYFAVADNMKEAYDKFRVWESANLFDGLPSEEIEEPHSISPAGELIIESPPEEDDEIASPEEIEAFKQRGPFHAEEKFSTPYLDILGRMQKKNRFVVLDAAGEEVAYSHSAEISNSWAEQLTEHGFVED